MGTGHRPPRPAGVCGEGADIYTVMLPSVQGAGLSLARASDVGLGSATGWLWGRLGKLQGQATVSLSAPQAGGQGDALGAAAPLERHVLVCCGIFCHCGSTAWGPGLSPVAGLPALPVSSSGLFPIFRLQHLPSRSWAQTSHPTAPPGFLSSQALLEQPDPSS